jgi:hypothetical protein
MSFPQDKRGEQVMLLIALLMFVCGLAIIMLSDARDDRGEADETVVENDYPEFLCPPLCVHGIPLNAECPYCRGDVLPFYRERRNGSGPKRG